MWGQVYGQVPGRLSVLTSTKRFYLKGTRRTRKNKEQRTTGKQNPVLFRRLSSVRDTFSAVSSIGGTFWAISTLGDTLWVVSSVGGTLWAVSRDGTLLAVLRVGPILAIYIVGGIFLVEAIEP